MGLYGQDKESAPDRYRSPLKDDGGMMMFLLMYGCVERQLLLKLAESNLWRFILHYLTFRVNPIQGICPS